ncbi:MAG: response regulator transcription factor [Spirosomataceae bacterium]
MHLLLVEDDHRLAELTKIGLEKQGFLVTVAYDGLFAQKLMRQTSFDLVISDIILPKLDGLAFCQWVRQSNPAFPIILLTALGTTDDKVEGFDAGADDYLVKPFEIRELVARIKALMNRVGKKSYVPFLQSVISYDQLEINLYTKEVVRDALRIDLTPKEFSLLLFFVQNPERVLSRQEIAEQVWETHYDTGTNFIDVYINYLRKKVDRPFQYKLIHTKPGMGFILRKEDEN